MSSDPPAGTAERLRGWGADNPWKVRFVALEMVLIVGAFALGALAGPPPTDISTEPTLRVISGMMLVYAGVLAIIAALLYVGYAAVGRLQQDSITAR